MPNKYIMGIDVGTQSVKVVIYGLDGSVVCQVKHLLRPLDLPQPRFAEHPQDDLWDTLQRACLDVMAQYKSDKSRDVGEIVGVGLCAIRCCRVLLQKNGELAHPVINWMDERLSRPFEYRDSYGQVDYVTTASGYLSFRLTGQRKDTCANYIGCWPMDEQTCRWSENPKQFQDCGLRPEMLFELVDPGQVLGVISESVSIKTGLPKGLPVVATAHDKAVEVLGLGGLENGTAFVSLGTYICVMMNGNKNSADSGSFWSFQGARPRERLFECMGVRRGMWTVSWFGQQFGGSASGGVGGKQESIEQYLENEAKLVTPGSDGLITVHDWAAPCEHPYRRGAFIGFDGRHGRAHMYRSLLEGIALTIKNNLEPMLQQLDVNLKKVVISGGGSRSDLILQIFSDVLGVPSYRTRLSGTASLGSAISAGVGCGVFESYEKAFEQMVTPLEEFRPDVKNVALYERLNHEVYRHAHVHLDPLYKNLQDAFC
jgi:sugar (pentulose or hexulose) kinase